MAPPPAHPKVIPYVDHVFSFFYADNKIWFRHYQIVEKDVAKLLGRGGITTGEAAPGSSSDPVLVEVGPRFVLDPIRIFQGSFSGTTIWKNHQFVPPSAVCTSLFSNTLTIYTFELFIFFTSLHIYSLSYLFFTTHHYNILLTLSTSFIRFLLHIFLQIRRRIRQQQGARYANRLNATRQAKERRKLYQPIIHPVEEVFYEDD